ncbi:hypothetical protein JCM10207_006724 [Rhodosporidiobolus poonsookiae]
MLLPTARTTLRTPSIRTRLFSSSSAHFAAPALSADVDHYARLGLRSDASRKQIKERFYELSRKHHPDAPSTSSESPEQRTARFQQLSQSYSVLSDPDQRRSYDLSRTGSSVPPHRRRPGHPGYTQGSGGMGYAAGRSDGAWTENDERRERANYAWQHPRKGTSAGETASGAAHARPDPFASKRSRAAPSSADHISAYARRQAIRQEQQQAQTGGAGAASADHHYRAGTSVFGAKKAEEESRLINDSSVMRSGQVAFMFASVFFIAILFSRGSKDEKRR